MTQLTWKDTAIPDFRDSADGYLAASKMFGNAISAAKDTLGGIERDQSNAAANAVLDRLLTYQGDPAKLEADLAAGTFQSQFDPKVMARLTPDMRKTLLDRPGELLAHAVETAKFGEQKKAIADSDRRRALEPVINQYKQLGFDDPTGKLQAEFRAAHPEMRNMSTADLDKILSGGLEDTKGQFGHLSNVQTYGQSQQEREIGINADRLLGELRDLLPEDRLSTVIKNRKDYVARHGVDAVNRVLANLDTATGGSGGAGGIGSGIAGAGGVSGGGTGIGGRPIYSVVLGDTANGGNAYGITPPKPVEQMTMGELYDFQRNVMIPKTKAAGIGKTESGQIVGSSAVGAYQIVSTTLERKARQLFGENWKDKTFDAATQDMLGEALFNDAKANGTDLHKVWEGLPPGTSPKGLTWAQVRDKITMNESGGTVANPREAKAFQDTAIEHQYATDPLTPLEVGFKENFNNTSSAKQMAIGMVAKGADFEGNDVDNLAALITKVAHDYDLSPALAAVAVRHSTNGKDGYFTEFGSNSFWGDGLKTYIDDGLLEKNAKALQDRPRLSAKVANTVTRTDRMANSGAAQAQLKSAQAKLDAKILAYRNRGITDRSKMNLANELMDVATAEALVNGTLAKGEQTMLAGEDPGPPAAPEKKPAKNPRAPLILAQAVQPSRPSGRGSMIATGGSGADTVRVTMAMNSGLPQYSRKSGESQAAWKARVEKIVLGK